MIQNQIQFQLDDEIKEQEELEEIFSNTLDKAAALEEEKRKSEDV